MSVGNPCAKDKTAMETLNATRDAVTGQVITLPEKTLSFFTHFKQSIVSGLNPAPGLETVIADAIAWDTWRLNNLRAIEMNLYALGTQNCPIDVKSENPQVETAMANADTFRRENSHFNRLSLQEKRLNSNIKLNLATLQSLQADRKQQFEQDLRDEMYMAQATDFRDLPYKAPTVPGRNGSVFSTSQVKAAVNRKTMLSDARGIVACAKERIQFPGAWENQDPIKPNSGLRVASAA